MAPQIDYTERVFKPMAEKFGVHFDLQLKRRGFFPKGGGLAKLTVTPVKYLRPVELVDRGKIVRVTGYAFVSGILSESVAQTIMKRAEEMIKASLGDEVEYDLKSEKLSEEEAFGTGSGIILVADTSTGCKIGGSGLGEANKSAVQIGEEAATEILNNIQAGGCVDEYLQDQLISKDSFCFQLAFKEFFWLLVFMSLAKGKSRVRVGPLTLHTKTSIHFSSCLTKAPFRITPDQDPETGQETFIIGEKKKKQQTCRFYLDF